MVGEKRSIKEQVLEQAGQIFIEQGYRGTAMRQIAEAVGVTKAALYYHFKDKEQLFIAVLERTLDVIEEVIRKAREEQTSAREQLRQAASGILSLPPGHRTSIRLARQELTHLSPESRQLLERAYRKKLIEPLREILQSGVERGELRMLDLDLALWAFMGMLYPYFYSSAGEGKQISNIELEELLKIYLEGVAASKN